MPNLFFSFIFCEDCIVYSKRVFPNIYLGQYFGGEGPMRTLCILLIGCFMIVPFVSGAGGNKPVAAPAEIWTVALDNTGDIIGNSVFRPTLGVERKAVYTPPSRTCSGYCVGSTFRVGLTAPTEQTLDFRNFEMMESEANQVPCNFYDSIGASSPACLAKFLKASPYPSITYPYASLKVNLYGFNFNQMYPGQELIYNPNAVQGQAVGPINRARIYFNIIRDADCTFPYSGVTSNAVTSVEDGTVSITRSIDGNSWKISVKEVSLDLGEQGYKDIPFRNGTRCSYYQYYDYESGIWTKPISFEMTFTRKLQ
jgi:hypothetical protein